MGIKGLKRYLLDHVSVLSVSEIVTRIKEINDYFTLGTDPAWATVPSESPIVLMFYKTAILNEAFMLNYQQVLNMHLLDKSKSFSLYPELKFEFEEIK
jgi:hypothetical protein